MEKNANKIFVKARDLLQSCKNGHKESISRLLTLVSDLSSNVKDGQASKATKLQTPQGARRLKSFSIPKPNPNAVSVQSRPHLNITGRRQIPRLVYANQFPFLRFKKPQSPFLSYVIRKKIEQRHKRFDRLHQADEAIEQAAHEDRWDELLSSSYGIGPGQGASEDEPQWTDVARAELRDMSFKLKAQERSNRRIARKMLDIINKEKQLARDEKVRRKVEKSLERKA
ncbi:MAG: hypothetical protein M1827_003281 [Pycnora praestabilis]|nr:MAG: hypothetical protein M1827_003281 [Pycnora praestabilis]